MTHGHCKGHKRSPEYHVWHGMRKRCNCPKHKSYAYYGGRGIRVVKRWEHFRFFLKDMGPRPSGKTLDRINVNGNYSPRNCKWADWNEQMRNRRKISVDNLAVR